MCPELVLNEDEKKRRFKKHLTKKEEEASNVSSSPEQTYSYDIEPSDTNTYSEIHFQGVPPFPYPFPLTRSSLYNQLMFPSEHESTFPDWNSYHGHETKNYRRSEKEFLSKLKLDVRRYVEDNQHRISQTTFSSIPQFHSTSPQAFHIPTSPRVPPNSTLNPCMPFPEDLPTLVASKRFLERNTIPQTTTSSPDSITNVDTKLYMEPVIRNPIGTDYVFQSEKHFELELSKHISNLRPSVISNPSCNPAKTTSNIEHPEDYCETEEEEKKTGHNLETTPDSSTKIDLLENGSISEDEGRKEESDENENHSFKYVHKKFRTNVVNSAKDSSSNTFPIQRKSVIFHACATKKIFIE